VDDLGAVRRLLSELELQPPEAGDWIGTYSIVELPFDGDVPASLERYASTQDWDVTGIDELSDWRDDLSSLMFPAGAGKVPAFGERAPELLRSLDALVGEAPAVWSVRMEERVTRGFDLPFLQALAAKDIDRVKQALDEDAEFDRRHPPRPPWPVDYLVAGRDRLFLLEFAFDA
jgi:hypothetical protein